MCYGLGIPNVKMLVAEKMGYHALPSLRPKEVVQATLYLLKRWKRTQEGSGTNKQDMVDSEDQSDLNKRSLQWWR